MFDIFRHLYAKRCASFVFVSLLMFFIWDTRRLLNAILYTIIERFMKFLICSKIHCVPLELELILLSVMNYRLVIWVRYFVIVYLLLFMKIACLTKQRVFCCYISYYLPQTSKFRRPLHYRYGICLHERKTIAKVVRTNGITHSIQNTVFRHGGTIYEINFFS